MEANELRMGNYFLETGSKIIYKLDCFYGFGTVKPYQEYDDDMCFDIDDISPIPLTEEILLKCGFSVKKSPILDFYDISISWNETFKEISLSIEQGNQYVYLREQNDELPNDRMADNLICIFNGDIHGKLYLHRLQNIIHALTNTELEINL